MSRDILTRSLKVAVVVGTMLALINNADLWLQGIVTANMFWKIPMTYCVLFCVSIYAGVAAARKK